MATKSAASVTKAPAKKTTKKPAERKLLPKKRQPLGPVAHNSRQIKPKVKRTEVIDLSVEDEDEQPLQKGLRRGVEDRKKLHDEEPERESEPGRLLSGTGVVHMSPTEKSIGKVKGKGKAIDIPGLATSAIKVSPTLPPQYTPSTNNPSDPLPLLLLLPQPSYHLPQLHHPPTTPNEPRHEPPLLPRFHQIPQHPRRFRRPQSRTRRQAICRRRLHR